MGFIQSGGVVVVMDFEAGDLVSFCFDVDEQLLLKEAQWISCGHSGPKIAIRFQVVLNAVSGEQILHLLEVFQIVAKYFIQVALQGVYLLRLQETGHDAHGKNAQHNHAYPIPRALEVRTRLWSPPSGMAVGEG